MVRVCVLAKHKKYGIDLKGYIRKKSTQKKLMSKN